MAPRDVVITGIGLVSSQGVGHAANWQAMATGPARPVLEAERYAPYTVHPMPEIDWNAQIAKRGDQRQMENWQRLGTYTAGLALDDAGIKDDEALCATMDMIVAAGGGERDEAVDAGILAASATRNDRDVLLNEKLTTELRPTLFLAQLSNLVAGNISIVHKVTGSSRTFMGEEGAGIAAVETAAARIRAGQSSHALVGGAFQTEHSDMLLAYDLGGYLHREAWHPVWERAGMEGGGVVTGSGAAFLVLELREHAAGRGRRPYAVIEAVASGRYPRYMGEAGLPDAIAALIAAVGGATRPLLTVSGASGGHQATAAEQAALDAAGPLAVRAFGSLTGHIKEAQFPFAIALAALAIHHRQALPPFLSPAETAFAGDLEAVLVTTVGYHRFEGAALITAP